MCQNNRSYLRVFIYITSSLLIVKGILWIAFDAYTFQHVFKGLVSYKGELTHEYLLVMLLIFSLLIFGIASLLFGIVGIVATAKKHSPALVATAVLLMLLFLAEVAIYIVLGVYKVLLIITWPLWVGVAGAVLTIVSFSLILAWNTRVKEERYD